MIGRRSKRAPVRGAKQSQTTLEEAALGFRARILEQIGDAVVCTDRAERVLYWGPGAEKLYGTPTCEAVGRPLGALFRQRFESPDSEREARECLSSQGIWRGECVHELQNGDIQRVESTLTPLFDSAGGLLGKLAVIRCLSHRRPASEEQRRLAVGAARLGFQACDLATGAQDWDARARELWGLPHGGPIAPEDLIAGIHPDDRPAAQAAFERALDPAGDGRLRVEVRAMGRVDGVERWVAIAGQAIFEAGRAVRWVSVVQDVTERRRALDEARRAAEGLERRLREGAEELASTTARLQSEIRQRARAEQELGESRQLLQEIVEGIGDAFYTTDAALRFTWLNRRAEEQWGRAREELLGSSLLNLAAGTGGSAFLGAHQRALQDRVPVHRVVDSLFGGPAAVDLYPRADGGLAVLVRELGERRGVEEATREAERQRAAAEELREADRRKNQFLAVLSHELRNPLSPIKNSLYILGRSPPGGEQARRAQAVMERQIGQLTRLVDDLLDATRISQNRIQLRRQRTELNELVQRAVEDQRSFFEKGDIRLRWEPAPVPLFVSGDPSRLSQVMGNLLQNAAKFSHRGGSTLVRLGAEPDGRATIRVIDDGVGMEPAVLHHLFKPFFQAESSLDRSRGGLGLGLALVKGLVELHGGQVSAHSDGPGKGSEFVVRLPLEEPVFLEGHEARGAHRSFRVLLIEGDLGSADGLRRSLEIGGHQVAVARGGTEGLAKARELKPEVVFCDLSQPGGAEGREIARAVKSDPMLKGARLVALASSAGPEDLRRAAEAGFDRYLAKPPPSEGIEAMLEAIGP